MISYALMAPSGVATSISRVCMRAILHPEGPKHPASHPAGRSLLRRRAHADSAIAITAAGAPGVSLAPPGTSQLQLPSLLGVPPLDELPDPSSGHRHASKPLPSS